MLLETRNLCFWYSPVFQALSDVSVAVPRGGTLGIVGESGCGKSTFAQGVTGLLKPTWGEVLS
ncbi:MAG: ATP-binding cassette domain-containing protein, partial [Kiritimatiellia bacterium]